jgi:Na+/proline symporter
MQIVSLILILAGFAIALVFGIQLLILAFRTSILWGLGYLFVPFVGLIFIALHWDEAKSPFLRSLLAIPCIIAGALLAPGAAR